MSTTHGDSEHWLRLPTGADTVNECPYCGALTEGQATHCGLCGLPFERPAPEPVKQPTSWMDSYTSRLWVALRYWLKGQWAVQSLTGRALMLMAGMALLLTPFVFTCSLCASLSARVTPTPTIQREVAVVREPTLLPTIASWTATPSRTAAAAASTDTPAPTPCPTASPTATPQPKGGVVVAAYLRAGPGRNYDKGSIVSEGQEVVLLERDQATEWYRVSAPSGEVGWLAANWMTLTAAEAVPVAAVIPPSPTPAPTPTMVVATATPVPRCHGATAVCCDGTCSYSAHRQGTCSWHGGVCQWYP